MDANNKFISKLQKFLTPLADFFQKNIYISSIGEGIQYTLPMILVGSIATLFSSLSPAFWQNFISSTGIKDTFTLVINLTLGLIALYASATISYRFAVRKKQEPLASVILSVGAFIILQGTDTSAISVKYLGTSGLFLAMVVGIIVPSILEMMMKKGWYIKMPAGVPPVVQNTFATITPAFLIMTVFGLISYFTGKTEAGSIPELFFSYLQKPFTAIGISYLGFMIIQLASQLVFFFGIHGSSVLSIAIPAWFAASMQNMEAYNAGQVLPNVINMDFFMLYGAIGGAGATICLLICMLIWGKSKRYKELAKIASVPVIFNINEPLIFGLPIILNPVMLIPWLLVQSLTYTGAYILTLNGILPKLIGLLLSFTIPTPINVVLSGGGVPGLIYILICIVIGTLIYYPFFKIMDNRALAEEKAS